MIDFFLLILTAKDVKNCKQYSYQMCPDTALFFSIFRTQDFFLLLLKGQLYLILKWPKLETGFSIIMVPN